MAAGRRRLAAILAADVAEYSRLIGVDEEGVIADLRRMKADIVAPRLEEFHGRIANTAGDSLLIEFQSAVDAVRAALAIQADILASNQQIDQARRLELRIGVHVGDVLAEGDDLLGDGINVAARLESLAVSGGVCVSRTALDQIQDRMGLDIEDMGEIAVKNIARPVHVFAIRRSAYDSAMAPSQVVASALKHRRLRILAAAVLAAVVASGIAVWALGPFDAPPAISSASAEKTYAIAVLPFVDQSDDGAQAYFAAGIAEDIGTELARIDALTVTAPAATQRYLGAAIDPREAAKALEVSAVVEGSVRRLDGKLRVTARLVDGETGAQIWAERYDRDDSDIFSIQGEIARRVAEALSIELATANTERRHTPDIAAYDAYIQGRAKRLPPTPENLRAAMTLFESAMEKDPKFAGGFSGAAFVQALLAFLPNPPLPLETHIAEALRLAKIAVALDPTFGPAHGALAEALLRAREYEMALDAARTAVRLAPNDSLMRALLARVLNFMGRPEEAEAEARQSLRMSPDSLPPLFFLGVAQRMQGRLDEAIATLREHHERLGGKLAIEPNLHLAAAFAEAGRPEDGASVINAIRAATPGVTLDFVIRTNPFQQEEDANAFLRAIKQTGLVEES